MNQVAMVCPLRRDQEAVSFANLGLGDPEAANFANGGPGRGSSERESANMPKLGINYPTSTYRLYQNRHHHQSLVSLTPESSLAVQCALLAGEQKYTCLQVRYLPYICTSVSDPDPGCFFPDSGSGSRQKNLFFKGKN